jgi:hypothetical protein
LGYSKNQTQRGEIHPLLGDEVAFNLFPDVLGCRTRRGQQWLARNSE